MTVLLLNIRNVPLFCIHFINKYGQNWFNVIQDHQKCFFLQTTGISEDLPVQTPAFTNAVRLYRQAKGHYGTWDMMCGQPSQVRTSLLFHSLH